MNICVLGADKHFFEKAEKIANEFNFTFIVEDFDSQNWRKEIKRLQKILPTYQAALLVENKGLSLLPLAVSTRQTLSPIYIDFMSSAWSRRLYNISSKTELAAKALGLHKKENMRVFDANAGLGQDSFVFAALGAEVFACERSPLVYCLLSDALQRAQQNSELRHIAERIKLLQGDAILQLAKGEAFESHSLYLDPMFPDKKHQALAKKEMQVFQNLVGADDDAEQLFNEALQYLFSRESCRRVVLKRPRLAGVLQAEKLGRQVFGNSTRFDLYFKS